MKAKMILQVMLISAAVVMSASPSPQDLPAAGEYIPSAVTKVVMLGTGTPNPDPLHSGCSVAVVVHDTPYIVDFGPGCVRRAAALSPTWGGAIPAMEVGRIRRAFLTHLHSDHTAGFPDLIFTPWVSGRNAPLEVFGPEGTAAMTQNILEAYREDIRYRLEGLEPVEPEGWKVTAHEIEEGTIYHDFQVKVEAFAVDHGTWPRAFGFRFTTPDRTIVISGDTRPCRKLIKAARGADILIHEVYSHARFQERPEVWKKYHAAHHTSTLELAAVAEEAKPGLLVLYHILFWGAGEEDLLKEIATGYKGRVVVGRDLTVY